MRDERQQPNTSLEDEHQYGSIFFDKNLYFHGLKKNDLSQFLSVLHHGILTRDDAQKKQLSIADYTPLYNSVDKVSVCVSPSIHKTFERRPHAAFPQYIRESVSFVLRDPGKVIDQPDFSTYIPGHITPGAHSGFEDERFIDGSIPPQSICGIMIPQEWLDQSVTKFGIEDKAFRETTVRNFLKNTIKNITIYNQNGEEIHL